MKRVVSSSLISVFILVLIAAGFFYYQYYRSGQGSVLEAVPADVAWLISCDPSSGELRQLAGTGFFAGHDSIPVISEWYAELLRMDSMAVNSEEIRSVFEQTSLIVSGHVTGPGSFSSIWYLLPGGNNADGTADKLVALFSGLNKNPSVRNYNGADIRELTWKGKTFSWTVSKGVFIGSFTAFLVEDALRQQRNGKNVSPATELSDYISKGDRKLITAIRYSGFQRWIQTQLNSSENIKLTAMQNVASWTVASADLHPAKISFSGISIVNDSSEFLNLFSKQDPVPVNMTSIIPSRSAAFVCWGFSDPGMWLKDLNRYQQNNDRTSDGYLKDSLLDYFKTWIGNEMGLVLSQPVNASGDNHYFGIISVKNESNCRSELIRLARDYGNNDPASNAQETYNGYTIRYLPVNSLMPDLYGPLFTKVTRFYYSVINGYLVIANQASSLRGFINDVKTKNLLASDERFKNLNAGIAPEANLRFYCSIPQSEKLFRSIAAPGWTDWLTRYGNTLKGYNGILFSVNRKEGVYVTKGNFGFYAKGNAGPRMLWNIKTDTTIKSGPFIPDSTGERIFVQDHDLQLYCFDQAGNILWKKKTETSIQSGIHPVDYYQNGNTQYLFNTVSFIYIVDSSGNNIANYPIRLPAAASSGMTVRSNNSGKTISYYIPCTNYRMYGYQVSGKPLQGFSTLRLPDLVTEPPVVFKKGRDELMLIRDQSGTGFIADMNGNRKFTLRAKINRLNNSPYIFNNDSTMLLSWMDASGKIWKSGTDGVISMSAELTADSITGAINLELNGDDTDDWIVTDENGMQAVTDDQLILFRYKTNGETFSNPQIIRFKTKTYIAVSGNKRFYLFNRDGTLYDGFPQPGSGDMKTFIDKEGNLLIAIISGPDSFNMYQVD